jgi:DNA-directed RNA polymerase subunit RPC12/RpoP
VGQNPTKPYPTAATASSSHPTDRPERKESLNFPLSPPIVRNNQNTEFLWDHAAALGQLFCIQPRHPSRTMQTAITSSQSICCPNCGSRSAERRWIKAAQTVRTQCPDCDYLLISCAVTANVVEAYFPSQAYRQDIIPASSRR